MGGTLAVAKFQNSALIIDALPVAASKATKAKTTLAPVQPSEPVAEPKSSEASNYAPVDLTAEMKKLDQHYGRAMGHLPPLGTLLKCYPISRNAYKRIFPFSTRQKIIHPSLDNLYSTTKCPNQVQQR